MQDIKVNPGRCEACLMHLRDCFCGKFTAITSSVALDVFIHYRDARKPTNTGRLAETCLLGARVHIHGERDKPTPPPHCDENSVLLFPSPGARLLNEVVEERAKNKRSPIRHLIVVDGNWSQASRMTKRIPGLSEIESVVLPPGPPSRYRLRREPHNRPEGLATAEAIYRALECLGDKLAADRLNEAFSYLVRSTLRTRGRRDLLDEYDVFD